MRSLLREMGNRLQPLVTVNTVDLRQWLLRPRPWHIYTCLLCIVLGGGVYGLTVGIWRAPEMGLYIAIKLPLLICFTLILNGLLNGILSMLLGSGLSFRQSILAQLISFALCGLILGALAPILFFFALQAPGPDSPASSVTHSSYLLTHTCVIAYAGVMANLRLFGLLRKATPSPRIAFITLFSWLGGNALVGSQLSYIMRPFFGSPNLTVAFLRDDPFNGTFLASIWRSLGQLLPTEVAAGTVALLIISLIILTKSLITKANSL